MVSSRPLVSVVIPTYNEEGWLPSLLQCLSRQTFKHFEIIVADNHSTDKTRALAKSAGARVTDGGLPGKGRNVGAAHARGEILFFIDADVLIPDGFLGKAVKEFQKKKCDVATTFIHSRSKHPFDHVFYFLCNAGVFFMQYINPIAHGFNIIVTKKCFDEVHGFDESLVAGEDFDFTQRVSKGRRFRILYSTYDIASVRRFNKIGRLNMFLQLIGMVFQTLVLRKKLRSKEDYDWSGYGKRVSKGKKITINRR